MMTGWSYLGFRKRNYSVPGDASNLVKWFNPVLFHHLVYDFPVVESFDFLIFAECAVEGKCKAGFATGDLEPVSM